MARPQEFEVRLSPDDQAQLLRDVRGWPAEFRKATRKRLREAAEPIRREVQQYVLAGPSHQSAHRLRKDIAKGVKVSIRSGATAGVAIVSKGNLAAAYDKRSFRHPDFGNRDVWITQEGRPYFGSRINQHASQLRAAIDHALTDAAHTFRTGEATQ